MKNKATLNFFGKIKSLVPTHKFEEIEKDLIVVPNEKLEAFWNIIIAGYPVDFASINYNQLYEYLKDKPIEYSHALTTFTTYPGLKAGIYITKTKWFELN